MIDEAALREGLKKLLATTEADIRLRVEEEPALNLVPAEPARE
jgi:hypothetical protein